MTSSLIITILAGVLPKLCARKKEQDNVEVVTEFPCLLEHPVQYKTDQFPSLVNFFKEF